MSGLDRTSGSNETTETSGETASIAEQIAETRAERDADRANPDNWDWYDPANAPGAEVADPEPWTPEELAAIKADLDSRGETGDQGGNPVQGEIQRPPLTDTPPQTSADQSTDIDDDSGRAGVDARSQTHPLAEAGHRTDAGTEPARPERHGPVDLPPPTDTAGETGDSSESGDGDHTGQMASSWGDTDTDGGVVIHYSDDVDPREAVYRLFDDPPARFTDTRPAEVGDTELPPELGDDTETSRTGEFTAVETGQSEDSQLGPLAQEPDVRATDDSRMVVDYGDQQIEVEERDGRWVPTDQDAGGDIYGPYGPHPPPELTDDDPLPDAKTTLREGETVVTKDHYPQGLLGDEAGDAYYARVGEGTRLERLTSPVEAEQAENPVTTELGKVPDGAGKMRELRQMAIKNADTLNDGGEHLQKAGEALVPTTSMPKWVDRLFANELPGNSGDANVFAAVIIAGVVTGAAGRWLYRIATRRQSEG